MYTVTEFTQKLYTQNTGFTSLLSGINSNIPKYISQHNCETKFNKETNKEKKPGSRALLLATSDNSSKAKSKLQKEIGMKQENIMIDKYEEILQQPIEERNEKIYTLNLLVDDKPIEMSGRIDGIIKKDNIIIEHKSRTTGLLNMVPFHEIVQCHIYMKMLDSKETRLIESFGTTMKVHTITFDSHVWDKILKLLSDFL